MKELGELCQLYVHLCGQGEEWHPVIRAYNKLVQSWRTQRRNKAVHIQLCPVRARGLEIA